MFSRSPEVRLLLALAAGAFQLAAAPVLRVCADPNNLPYSNRAQQGLENRLAGILAADLGMKVQYVWWEQKKNFIEKSLNAGACDAILGVPANLDSVAATQPYYSSIYVWVQRRHAAPPLSSLFDERLASLKVGVHIVDDSYAPPAQVLAQNGLARNLVGFSLFGDSPDSNPAAHIIEAVTRGEVDAALVWGPLAGYFAGSQLELTPVSPPRFGMVPFVYDIAVGVRRGDDALRAKLDAAISHQCAAIELLLREFKVPQVSQDERRPPCASALSASAPASLR
jgi:mxaJ protein